MINLIPKEEKNRKIKIFYCRLSVVILFMVGVSVFIGFISLLPAYFVSLAKHNAVNQKLELQKKEMIPTLSEETNLVVERINFKLDLIENAQKNQFLVSEKIISAIIANKMPEIKIINISYENDKITGKKVNIRGNAPSREALLSFRLALESDELFKKVDLPISNFVKGSDIQFSLSLIPL